MVRDARARLGLTQMEFADRYGLSQPMLSKYEKGVVPPPAELLVRCLETLRLKVEEVSQEQLLELVRTRLSGAGMGTVRRAIADVITCLPGRTGPG